MDDETIGSSILNPRLLAGTEHEVSSRRIALKRVADATRVLIENLVGTDLDEATINATAERLEALAGTFDRDAPGSTYDGVWESAMAGGEPDATFDHSPMIGRANPLAPPITLELFENLVVGRVNFGSAYEGPPGCVHGGYVACAFDEILGAAQTFSGAPGMTGTLTIRYRKPTPLHQDLRFEGRFDRKEGRKVFTTGQVFAGDLLTAEAEGIFVSIPATRFTELREERDRRMR